MITLSCSQHWRITLPLMKEAVLPSVYITGLVTRSCNRCIITRPRPSDLWSPRFSFPILSARSGRDEGQIIFHFRSHQLSPVRWSPPLDRLWTNMDFLCVCCVIKRFVSLIQRHRQQGNKDSHMEGSVLRISPLQCWWLHRLRREGDVGSVVSIEVMWFWSELVLTSALSDSHQKSKCISLHQAGFNVFLSITCDWISGACSIGTRDDPILLFSSRYRFPIPGFYRNTDIEYRSNTCT